MLDYVSIKTWGAGVSQYNMMVYQDFVCPFSKQHTYTTSRTKTLVALHCIIVV